jgi:hypothetical protein
VKQRFRDKKADGQSLVHLINLLGPDTVGVEVGVDRAWTHCTLIECCPNLKTLYGIDSYKPYKDYHVYNYDGVTVAHTYEQRHVDAAKEAALRNIALCVNADKSKMLFVDSVDALSLFADNSIDFVFLDAGMTLELYEQDIRDWYPKVRLGGIVSGHDWDGSAVQIGVKRFIEQHNITSTLSTFDNTWVFIK